MKRSVLMLMIFGVAGAWACSPTSPSPPLPATTPIVQAAGNASEDVETAITRLERDWAAAIVGKNLATLDRLLADDFNETSPTAYTLPKSQAIEDLKSGTYTVKKMDLDEISVNVYGDTAVSFTSQDEQSTYAGKNTSGHYHFTDVWVKKNNRWQVVASHGSRFDQPHKEAFPKAK
jgi:ketosteroid isomerase-like protein